jgi:hypothetical protein
MSIKDFEADDLTAGTTMKENSRLRQENESLRKECRQLNGHHLGIVIAPAIVMAAVRPPMKAAIVIAVFRDNNCSILRVCGYGGKGN